MPVAGEHHGEAGLVGGLDHLVVAHRAAGLDHRGGAGLRRGEEPVREGEEGVGGDDRALGEALRRPPAFAASPAFQAAMREESTRLIWPAPMPTVAPSLAYTMAFDFTCLATRKAKRRSSSSRSVGRAS